MGELLWKLTVRRYKLIWYPHSKQLSITCDKYEEYKKEEQGYVDLDLLSYQSFKLCKVE